MENYLTETNRDNLCDMLWWLKGYKKGADNNFEECPFKEEHLNTLDEVVRGMRDELNKKEKEKSTDRVYVKGLHENKFDSLSIGLEVQSYILSGITPTTQKAKDIIDTIKKSFNEPVVTSLDFAAQLEFVRTNIDSPSNMQSTVEMYKAIERSLLWLQQHTVIKEN